MRRSAAVIFFLLFVLLTLDQNGRAQAVESGDERGFHVRAGAMASGFMPGDVNQGIVGAGTYVDLHFTHWFQVEAEGRWMPWHGYFGETQSNYLIGPRVPVYRVGRRGQIYGKALIGLGKMDFPFGGYGTFTATAFGGSFDYRLSRKLTLRPIDFEYQYWPVWVRNQSLEPYGVSVGMSYRVF
ncbi:MAG TPA: hypothetical protein VGL22_17095 [Terracidiphilus sp.]|jgi:hypothetical protein